MVMAVDNCCGGAGGKLVVIMSRYSKIRIADRNQQETRMFLSAQSQLHIEHSLRSALADELNLIRL